MNKTPHEWIIKAVLAIAVLAFVISLFTPLAVFTTFSNTKDLRQFGLWIAGLTFQESVIIVQVFWKLATDMTGYNLVFLVLILLAALIPLRKAWILWVYVSADTIWKQDRAFVKLKKIRFFNALSFIDLYLLSITALVVKGIPLMKVTISAGFWLLLIALIVLYVLTEIVYRKHSKLIS